MAAVSPDLFSGLTYAASPNFARRSIATVVGVPSEPATFYMGAANGGVFKTTDSGVTWTPITDGNSRQEHRRSSRSPTPIRTSSGSAPDRRTRAATSPTATASASRPTPARRGRTWARKAGTIGRVRIDPRTEHVFVAVIGNIFGANKERGVYRTKGRRQDLVAGPDQRKTGASTS